VREKAYLQIDGRGPWMVYSLETSDDPEKGVIPPSSEWTFVGPDESGDLNEEEMVGRLGERFTGGVTRHEVTFDTRPAVLLLTSGWDRRTSDGVFFSPYSMPGASGGDCLVRACLIVVIVGGGLTGLGYLVVGIVASMS